MALRIRQLGINEAVKDARENYISDATQSSYDLYLDIAPELDSLFFFLPEEEKSKIVSFRGRNMRQDEINYYFQGQLASALDLSYPTLVTMIYGWKAIQYRGLPSDDELWVAKIGYQKWQRDFANAQDSMSDNDFLSVASRWDTIPLLQQGFKITLDCDIKPTSKRQAANEPTIGK